MSTMGTTGHRGAMGAGARGAGGGAMGREAGREAAREVMLACASCSTDNRAHRGYCKECGTALQPVCRGCRFVNEGGDKFCGGCGSPLIAGMAAAAMEEMPAASAGPRSSAAGPASGLGGSGLPRAAAEGGKAARKPDDASALMRGDSELAALLAPAAVATPSDGLPSTNITQADLDKLFGGRS